MTEQERIEAYEWVRNRAQEIIAQVDAEEGGSTGSNLAERPVVPPGPIEIPDNLPPDEKLRREKLVARSRGLFDNWPD